MIAHRLTTLQNCDRIYELKNNKFNEINKEKLKSMKVVILAGGLGSRLIEKTNIIPKPMVQIGGKPIIWHIMKYFSHYGYNEFIICLGYKGEVIKEYFTSYLTNNSDLTIELKK